jgi:acetoin utilization deacetylase AcuC-like enzyme
MIAAPTRPEEPQPVAIYVYSPHYRVDIGAHVFPTAKYDLLRRRLIDEHGVTEDQFVEPEPATAAEILLVHTPAYYEACRDNTLTVDEQLRMELPWSPALFDAATRCVRGSIMAARLALRHGAGLHVGGGFHHAFADHGEGFCVFNDPACAVRRLQHEGLIERALIADVDLHQGNGTAAIFAGDATVATFSIHQGPLYPFPKPPSTVDVGLDPGTDDDAYIHLLERRLVPLIDDHRPDLLVYVAGADPYREDQLGALGLTIEGLRRRDAFVTDACAQRDLPMMVVLAGGYARHTEDTVSIHVGTLLEVARLWRDDEGA